MLRSQIMNKPILLCGSANKPLALAIAKNLSLSLGKIMLDRFSDNEIRLELLEDVRHKNIFILQSTCPPTNDNLMELMLIINAVKKAGASLITAIIPYFGYARDDINSHVIASMLETAGVNKILTIDLHTEKIISFFKIPCVNSSSTSLFVKDIKLQSFTAPTIISPDLGGITRVKILASQLSCSNIVIIHKHRDQENNITMLQTTANVHNQDCILIDDIVDTAATICMAAQILKSQGAAQIIAYCTHAILSGQAIENINNSELTEVVVSNTVLLSAAAKNCFKIRQLDIAPFLATAILSTLAP